MLGKNISYCMFIKIAQNQNERTMSLLVGQLDDDGWCTCKTGGSLVNRAPSAADRENAKNYPFRAAGSLAWNRNVR